ncbi:catalytic protein [Leptodontidium sp. 2 PMI_412]|nr:catalytic protein [Leptodontidium sp. 2 PMI_412]
MAIFRSISHGVHLPTAMRNGIARSFLTSLLPQQLQHLLPSGPTVFRKWIAGKNNIRKNKTSGAIEMLEDGESRLFWVGERDPSSTVVLLFHGGGYVLPLSKGHLEWANFLCEAASTADGKASVALLDYSLCPENVYPKQMRQAALALEHLISLGYSPSKILIGGDSAGGHLALSLLSYLMHQYPGDESSGKSLPEPLSGCFLISPLLSLDLNTISYRENRNADLLSIHIIKSWGADLFRNSRFETEKEMGKAWGMALSGDDDWWNRLGEVVKRIYLVGGSEELFRDHIIEFGKRLRNVPKVGLSTYIVEKEAHDGTFMEFETGAPLSNSTWRLGNWVADCLRPLQSECR